MLLLINIFPISIAVVSLKSSVFHLNLYNTNCTITLEDEMKISKSFYYSLIAGGYFLENSPCRVYQSEIILQNYNHNLNMISVISTSSALYSFPLTLIVAQYLCYYVV